MYLAFDFLSNRTVIKKGRKENIIEPESPFLQAFLPFSSLSETGEYNQAAFFADCSYVPQAFKVLHWETCSRSLPLRFSFILLKCFFCRPMLSPSASQPQGVWNQYPHYQCLQMEMDRFSTTFLLPAFAFHSPSIGSTFLEPVLSS